MRIFLFGYRTSSSHGQSGRRISVFLGTVCNALPVLLRHCRPRVGISVQPVKNQCLDHTLGIGEMLRAIILESGEGLAVKAICPLDGLRLWFGFRRAAS